MMRLSLQILRYTSLLVLAVAVLVIGLNFWVVTSTEDQVFRTIEEIPSRNVALILGTSKRTVEGDANKYFHERINAAAKLFHAGKVKHIIVSGDNRTIYYNEPRDMYNALVNLNVPKGVITLDFAGLRTLDSIVRSDSIFGQKNVVIVTQDFHCYRSLFIANYFDLNAVAFSADAKETIPVELAIREIFARFVAVFDLYIWNKKPAIMGEMEEIDL